MSVSRSVAEVLADHVTLEVEGIEPDRRAGTSRLSIRGQARPANKTAGRTAGRRPAGGSLKKAATQNTPKAGRRALRLSGGSPPDNKTAVVLELIGRA